MSQDKPWSPTLENAKPFQDHKNPLPDEPPLHVELDDGDTAPLQGSKDLSDPDSLDDVIAESYEPTGKRKVPPRS